MGIHLNWLVELRTHWHGTRAALFTSLVVLAIVWGFRVFLKSAPKEISNKYGSRLFFGVIASWCLGMCTNGVIRGVEGYARTGSFFFAGFEELGGILFAQVFVVQFCRRGLSTREVLDHYALSVLAFLTLSSLGCFVAGCCDGVASIVPWAIAGPPPLPGAMQHYFHPTQVYSSLGYGVLFLLTRRMVASSPAGSRAIFAFTGIFVFRFLLQFHKQNHLSPIMLGALDDLQVTAIVVWFISLVPLVELKKSRAFRSISQDSRAFTIVELMFVIIILGILYKVYTAEFGNNLDAQKYEETRARLEAIRMAILGDKNLSSDGKRTHFGYYGDMGSLPATLADLVTVGSQPAWAYSTWHRVGIGWRGPYLTQGPTGSITYTKDAWGNTIYYDTSLPATIRSYGSDNAASGTGYATDMTFSIPSTDLRATVKVMITDRGQPMTNTVVFGWMYYPSSGAWGTSGAALINDYGDVTLTNIPFGVRSLQASYLRPMPVTVDSPYTIIGPLDLAGGTRWVTFTAGTKKQGTSTNIVQATLASVHGKELMLGTITVGTWTPGPANLVRVGLNGMSQTVSVGSGGGSITVNTRLSILANQSVNILELEFDGDATGLTMPTLTFSYTNDTNTDSISIT